MPKTLLAAAALAWVLVGPATAMAQTPEHGPTPEQAAEEFQGYVPGADRLEGRILAPCCWNQTLDIHGSEIANELKREIRQRLRRGDSPDAIEADFVARYGERILAVPPKSPLQNLAIALSFGMGLAGVGAVVMLVRWRKRTQQNPSEATPAPSAPEKRDELDDRIDQELDRAD